MSDVDEKALDKLDARACHAMAVAVDEGWFDDESALDTFAPKAARWAYSDAMDRDPRETADAFYIAACDPAVVRSMISELRRRRAADLSEEDRADLRDARRRLDDYWPDIMRDAVEVIDRLIGDVP